MNAPSVEEVISPNPDDAFCPGNIIVNDDSTHDIYLNCELDDGFSYGLYVAVDSDGQGSDPSLTGRGFTYASLSPSKAPTWDPNTIWPHRVATGSNFGTLGFDLLYTIVEPNAGVGRIYWGVNVGDTVLTMQALLAGTNSGSENALQQESAQSSDSFTANISISCPLSYGTEFDFGVAVDNKDGFEATLIANITDLSLARKIIHKRNW